jgi:hypothetical protein
VLYLTPILITLLASADRLVTADYRQHRALKPTRPPVGGQKEGRHTREARRRVRRTGAAEAGPVVSVLRRRRPRGRVTAADRISPDNLRVSSPASGKTATIDTFSVGISVCPPAETRGTEGQRGTPGHVTGRWPDTKPPPAMGGGWVGWVWSGDSVGYFSGTASDRRLPVRTGGWIIKATSVSLTLTHSKRSQTSAKAR